MGLKTSLAPILNVPNFRPEKQKFIGCLIKAIRKAIKNPIERPS
ncbi:MAG: hypothetical protein ACFFAN_11880 [Promethearchaeota archaeon]